MKYWILAALFLTGCARRDSLPILGEVPDFQLISQSGQTITRRQLDGKPWVASFMFTSCTGPCPRMNYQLSRLQRATRDIRLVSFTVDPAGDTPSVLSEYAKRYQAEPERWFFLTGDQKTLNMLDYDAFKLGNVDGSFEHSTRFVLVDGQGRIRAYYTTEDGSPVERIVKDLKRL